MAMRSMRAAWVAAAALGCGCAMVLGVDPDDYELVCQPGALQCKGNTAQSCGPDGLWHEVVCMGPCVGGACRWCEAGAVQCTGNTPQSCVGGYYWQDQTVCTGQTCVDGACQGVCEPGAVQCAGNTPQSCGSDGYWQNEAECASPLGLCNAGQCVPAPNCAGLPATCGAGGNENCCASALLPKGTYNRSNNTMYQATVDEFRLDRFEIIVGRFRAFVAAYPASKPAAGAGAHPLIMGSGWDSMWDGNLPADQAALIAAVKCISPTWTDMVGTGANENLPMNCITWYEAFAFCAWDGGRLPTEAEWNYAAAGGMEQREYPWGSATPGPSYAVFECTGDGSQAGMCAFADILRAGSKSPMGDGRWGQADLAGSIWEWNLDWHESGYASTIAYNNCANIAIGSGRVMRSGGWSNSALYLVSSYRLSVTPTGRGNGDLGARCARTP